MGRKVKNLTGKRFGRLLVIGIDEHNNARRKYWICKCNCGNVKSIRGDQLKTGETNSCGCLRVEVNTTHGMRHLPEYNVWKSMKQRCYLKTSKTYSGYGSRGISVCSEWKNSFETFIIDMGRRPSVDHSIERRDNNGNYCKDNCKWSTDTEQTRNKRNNVWLSHSGKKMILTDWAVSIGINKATLWRRIFKLKWSIERALTEPINNRGQK